MPIALIDAASTKFRYQNAVVACARWEERYIVEWLNYYRAIGFDHVFLYCNDDDPAPLFALVEGMTIGAAPFVTFRHHAPQGQQREMYLDFLTNYGHLSAWFGFFDIDEFLRIPPGATIDSFLARFADDVGAVLFNWVFFGPNGHKTPPDMGVLEAFTRRQAYLHQNTKFLMRSAALVENLADYDQGDHPFWHRPNALVRSDYMICNALGEDARDYYEGFPDAPLAFINEEPRLTRIFETALIHHYAFRSEQAFAERAARGTLGSFAGQAMWKDLAEGDGFAGFLAAINQVEDLSLASFWQEHGSLLPGCADRGDVSDDRGIVSPCLLSLRKAATQSSLSAWSRGQTVADDASGAVDGIIDGRAGFHTDYEYRPWWQVDLGADVLVGEVRVYNRLDQPEVAGRASRLAIEVGAAPEALLEVFRREEVEPFGGVDGHPLIVRFPAPIEARFIRVRLLGTDFLHLDQVEVFGPGDRPGGIKSVAGPSLAVGASADFGRSDREVMERFQSIGNNCEFGSVQKSLGIGKLSLLQWTASNPHMLIKAVRNGFRDYGDSGAFEVVENAGEYFFRDTHYNLESHSFISVNTMDTDRFKKFIIGRNKFLIRKFIEDIDDGGNIFVYNFFGGVLPDMDVLVELAGVLSRHAPNYLLAVGLPGDYCAEQNTVFHQQPGLVLATKDEHTTFNSAPPQYRPGWMKICRAALALIERADPEFWALHERRVADGRADEDRVAFAPGNICQGKVATQSSLSAYSIGRSLEEDACGAINGRIDGQAKFHTDMEDSPWWQVDLGAVFGVTAVKIYNRIDVPGVMARASHLAIEIGLEPDHLVEFYRRESDAPFGGFEGEPLVFAPMMPVPGRFVRVRLLRRDYLHLDQVEVFGAAIPVDNLIALTSSSGGEQNIQDGDISDHDLFSQFTSLGLNCELGIVQKISGVTKLGLLDWCATSANSVLEMLKQNFEGVGDANQTKIAIKNDDYDVFDLRYNFAGHTFVNPNEVTEEVFFKQITQRLKFLRRKFLEELEDGEGIFVYKMNGNPIDPRLARDIGLQIRKYGNGAFLSVCDANVTGCPNGLIRWLGGNIFEGHLSKMADLSDVTSVSTENWRVLCRNALQVISDWRQGSELNGSQLRGKDGERGFWFKELVNIASGKRAAQSCVSPWSRASFTELEASGGVTGHPNGGANFHTGYEASPWWMVDLGGDFELTAIVLFNRIDEYEIMRRSSRLVIEVASSESGFEEIFRRESDEPFGGIDGHPLICMTEYPRRGRFVLVRLIAENFLHLDKIEVYGEALPGFG